MADLLLYAAINSQNKMLFPPEVPGASFTVTGTTETNSTLINPAYTGLGVDGSKSGPNVWRNTLISQWEKDIGPFTQPKTHSYCCMDNYSTHYRCGFNDSFCVPPGVSRVTFQLWGAGSGSASMCCCGGSPAGINGAYAMFQVDVCPGEVFCMCGGCAFCCCGDLNSLGGISGTCGTFITYCGNPNDGNIAGGSSTEYTVCAPGANGTHVCLWNCQMSKVFSGYTTNCAMELPSIVSCINIIGDGRSSVHVITKADLIGSLTMPRFPNNCRGPHANCQAQTCGSCWSFCWDSGTDDLYVPPIYGCRIPFASTTSSFTAKNAILKGIPTMYPEILVTCIHATAAGNCDGHKGFTQPAPVYGFTTPLRGVLDEMDPNPQNSMAIMPFCIAPSGTPGCNTGCGGHCSNALAGGLCIPGMGATGSFMQGGGNASSFRGGTGRTGMICISWECS